MITRSMLLLSAAAGALFAAAPALAQVKSADTAEETADRSMGEIIVTAQRRSQRLQDVPVSVTALSGDALQSQGVTSTHDLAQSVTGMTITESGGFVQPFIRGVGSTVTNIGEPGSAAFYIDGVYMPTVNGQLYQLANIESIQVLKGPQGTLFGRNANTGAILITTKQPQFEPHMTVNLGAGNYRSLAGSGFVTGPLGESVAVSLAGNYDSHDGWFNNKNPANGFGRKVGDSQRWTMRGTALIQASDDLEVTISADAMRIHDASPIFVQPINGYQGYVPGGLLPTGPYDYIGNEHTRYHVEQQGLSAKIAWNLGGTTLTSTTAYRHFENHAINYDSDTTPALLAELNNNDVGNNFTQELLLNSAKNDTFNWIVGAFLLRQDARLDPLHLRTPAGLTAIMAHQITDAYAGFADGTLKLGKFELTAGLRYSYEKKRINGILNGNRVLPRPPSTAKWQEKSWDAFTPRAVIAYKPTDQVMVYGSFSKGFKSGAFNSNALSPTPIDPENVDAFEAGAKFSPSHGLTINGAAFYYTTKDLQVQALNPVNNLIELLNAAKVVSKGFDVDVAYSPVSKLNLALGISYLNAKFDSFPRAQVFVPVPGGDGRNAPQIVNATGKHNVRSPDWTVNVAADYKFEMANGGSIQPSFNVYYSSKFYWTVDNRISEPSHVVLNASLTWNLPGDRFSVAIWGRNVTDELRFRNVSAASNADRRAADEPALYGLRLGYRF